MDLLFNGLLLRGTVNEGDFGVWLNLAGGHGSKLWLQFHSIHEGFFYGEGRRFQLSVELRLLFRWRSGLEVGIFNIV